MKLKRAASSITPNLFMRRAARAFRQVGVPRVNRDRGRSHDGGSVSKTWRRWNPGISHTNPYLSPDVKVREPLAAIAAPEHRRPMKADNGGERVWVRTREGKKSREREGPLLPSAP